MSHCIPGKFKRSKDLNLKNEVTEILEEHKKEFLYQPGGGLSI